MASWLALLIIGAAGAITGRLILELLSGKEPIDGDWVASWVAALALGIMLIGWQALILSEVGLFSVQLLALLWLASLLSLLALRRRSRADRGQQMDGSTAESEPTVPPLPLLSARPARIELVLLGLWLVGASWLFFRPHEYVLGAADAGVYVNLAASVSQSGGILIDDPTLADLDPALYPALLRRLPPQERASEVAPYYLLPGFYVTGTPRGRVTPQFYPLHPVWQAVAYSLGGVQAALRLSGLWALLGALTVFLVARQMAGRVVAFLSLGGLTANGMQIWFARYPTAEALSQFLLWTGVWATAAWLVGRRPRRLWGVLAGAAFGQLFLTRIDSYFLLLIPLLITLWLLYRGRLSWGAGWFLIPLSLLTVHSLAHAQVQSRPYFYSIFGHGLSLIRPLWPYVLGILILAGGSFFAGRAYRNQFGRITRRRTVLGFIALLVVLLALYAYFLRPVLGTGDGIINYWYGGERYSAGLDRANLVRLGWYLSPLGIGLAVTGIALMIVEIDRQRIIALVAGLTFALIYLWRIQANPVQIYTMRRYVPAVMPLAILAAAYFLARLYWHRTLWVRSAGAILAAAWIALLVMAGRDFVSQEDYRGFTEQLADVDRQMPARSILLFDDQSAVTKGDLVGTPLHFLFEHDVFSLRDPAALDGGQLKATVEKWQAAGRVVFWVGDEPPAAEYNLAVEPSFTANLSYRVMEGLYDRKPSQVYQVEWPLNFSRIR